MDRFIEFVREFFLIFSEFLKSNMDRFIGGIGNNSVIFLPLLKSNMDRFIVDKKQADYNVIIFKIQYG